MIFESGIVFPVYKKYSLKYGIAKISIFQKCVDRSLIISHYRFFVRRRTRIVRALGRHFYVFGECLTNTNSVDNIIKNNLYYRIGCKLLGILKAISKNSSF